MEFKKYISKFLSIKRKKRSRKEIILCQKILQITGVYVRDIRYYQEAFSLRTSLSVKNYERLEFLGDSILGSIISCYLFERYPHESEGYLTQMKSKIVNRKNLNHIGDDLHLTTLIQNDNNSALSKNISGNLFEAFIGAIYMDIGYESCKKIVLNKLLTAEKIAKLEHQIASYKGLLLEWSQKKKVTLLYETNEELLPQKVLMFRSSVFIDGKKVCSASDSSKKKAEEKAAKRAFYTLNKKEHILEKHKVSIG